MGVDADFGEAERGLVSLVGDGADAGVGGEEGLAAGGGDGGEAGVEGGEGVDDAGAGGAGLFGEEVAGGFGVEEGGDGGVVEPGGVVGGGGVGGGSAGMGAPPRPINVLQCRPRFCNQSSPSPSVRASGSTRGC